MIGPWINDWFQRCDKMEFGRISSKLVESRWFHRSIRYWITTQWSQMMFVPCTVVWVRYFTGLYNQRMPTVDGFAWLSRLWWTSSITCVIALLARSSSLFNYRHFGQCLPLTLFISFIEFGDWPQKNSFNSANWFDCGSRQGPFAFVPLSVPNRLGESMFAHCFSYDRLLNCIQCISEPDRPWWGELGVIRPNFVVIEKGESVLFVLNWFRVVSTMRLSRQKRNHNLWPTLSQRSVSMSCLLLFMFAWLAIQIHRRFLHRSKRFDFECQWKFIDFPTVVPFSFSPFVVASVCASAEGHENSFAYWKYVDTTSILFRLSNNLGNINLKKDSMITKLRARFSERTAK